MSAPRTPWDKTRRARELADRRRAALEGGRPEDLAAIDAEEAAARQAEAEEARPAGYVMRPPPIHLDHRLPEAERVVELLDEYQGQRRGRPARDAELDLQIEAMLRSAEVEAVDCEACGAEVPVPQLRFDAAGRCLCAGCAS